MCLTRRFFLHPSLYLSIYLSFLSLSLSLSLSTNTSFFAPVCAWVVCVLFTVFLFGAPPEDELRDVDIRPGVQDDAAGEAREAANPEVEPGRQDGHGHDAQQEGCQGAALLLGVSAVQGVVISIAVCCAFRQICTDFGLKRTL